MTMYATSSSRFTRQCGHHPLEHQAKQPTSARHATSTVCFLRKRTCARRAQSSRSSQLSSTWQFPDSPSTPAPRRKPTSSLAPSPLTATMTTDRRKTSTRHTACSPCPDMASWCFVHAAARYATPTTRLSCTKRTASSMANATDKNSSTTHAVFHTPPVVSLLAS